MVCIRLLMTLSLLDKDKAVWAAREPMTRKRLLALVGIPSCQEAHQDSLAEVKDEAMVHLVDLETEALAVALVEGILFEIGRNLGFNEEN